MSKLAPSSTKYIIRAQIKAKGIIEKPDVIGAVFGQTEGLLGSDLNLRELQRTGKIGRIEVNVKSIKGSSEGEIIIPTSLSSAETSLIAATLETIERVGPCNATIKLDNIEDAMKNKRQYVVDKAKEIMQKMMENSSMDIDEVSDQLKESVRSQEITTYEGLPAGPAVADSESIIIVEGRADVIKLLKYGLKNAIAIEGTSVPKQVEKLSKEKEVTVLVDGDRGGLLIVKELMQVAEIDFIAHAPEGKEVEESTQKEVFKALRDKIPASQFKGELLEKRLPMKNMQSQPRRDNRSPMGDRKPLRDSRPIRQKPRIKLKTEQKVLFKKTLDELVGTRAACIFNDKNELMGKVPLSELGNIVRTLDDPYCIVFDGKVDYNIDDIARKKNTIKLLIGMEKDVISSPITIMSREDL